MPNTPFFNWPLMEGQHAQPWDTFNESIQGVEDVAKNFNSILFSVLSKSVESGNVTLSATEALEGIVKITGAPGTPRELVYPDGSVGTRKVINTSNAVLTVKNDASDTGVEVSVNFMAVIALDGTNAKQLPRPTSQSVASTVIYRDSSGRAQVEDPDADKDIANKQWVLANGSGAVWGGVIGTLADQTDLQAALDDKQDTSEKGTADGYAELDENALLPIERIPTSLLGAIRYQGTWNATTNSPAIPAAAAGNKGYYYKVSTAGTTSIDGIAEWGVNDLIISNGTTWDKVDNTEQLTSELAEETTPTDATVIRGSIAGNERKFSLANIFTLLLNAARTVSAKWTFTSGIVFTPHSPSQLTADQDNYALNAASIIRLSTDSNHRAVTGFVAGSDGESKWLINVGSFNLILRHEITSTAANRLTCPDGADFVLLPGATVQIVYSGTTSRWRIVSAQQGVGSNLLPNAGMNEWSGGLPLGYSSVASSNWNSGSNVTQESTIVDEFPYSARIGSGSTNSTGMCLTNAIRVIPGRVYTLSARIYGADATAVFRPYVRIYQSDGTTEITTGTPLGPEWSWSAGVGAWLANTTTPGTSWVDWSKTLPLDSTVYYVKPAWLYNGSGGVGFRYIYIDSLALTLGNKRPRWSLRPLFDSSAQTLWGTLGIGVSSNHATAALQVDSTTQGVLAPRMTTTQRDAISTPATGLLIFNTTNSQFEHYSGSAWVATGPAGSGIAATIVDAKGDLIAATAADTVARLAAGSNGQILKADSAQSTGLIWANAAYLDPAYISGMELEWVSTTQIKVKSGACYVEGSAAIYAATGDTTLTPTISGSQWYYIYAYNNSGVLAFEESTTAPTTAYRGTARSKTGDTSRRFVGAFRVQSAAILNVQWHANGNQVRAKYRKQLSSAPNRVLVSGAATSFTSVDCSGVLPATARMLDMEIQNASSSGQVNFNTSQSDSGAQVIYLNANQFFLASEFPVNTTPAFQYQCSGGSGYNIICDVVGYTEYR